jgi:hypothetical protein
VFDVVLYECEPIILIVESEVEVCSVARIC